MSRRQSPGRPIVPDSERQTKPWQALGISRAAYYWRKKYNDLPPAPVLRRIVWRITRI